MEHLPLPVCRESRAEAFCNAPVHIPFHIGNICLSKNLFHHPVDTVHNLFPGEIQHILEPAVGRRSAGHVKDPIRMSAVEVRIFVHHLRLKPETELHSQISDAACKSGNAVRQPIPVGHPVPKTRMLRTALPEPAVVQDKELYAAVSCLPGNVQYPFLIEIHICGFPVVDEDRALPVSPVSSCQSFLVQLMEGLAQIVQSPVRIDHHSLRRLECLSRLKFPVKAVRMDPHKDSCGAMGADFRLGKKIAAVDKAESNRLSLELICMRSL